MESIVTMVLEDEGFLILPTNFTSILKDSIEFKPDLVIISPRLRSCLEITTLCKQLRLDHHRPELPIIFLSARFDLKVFAYQCDASAYISKPFEIADLCNTVKDVLSI